MFFWMSVNFFLPVLPIYYHTLGMNDHQVGLAVGAFSLGSVMFRLYSGTAVGRYGGWPVLAAGVLLSTAAIGGYYFAVTLAAATIVRFLHGAGVSGYSAADLTTFLPLLMLSRGITEFNSFYVAYSVAVILSRLWITVFAAAGVYTLAYAALYQLWLRGKIGGAEAEQCKIE